MWYSTHWTDPCFIAHQWFKCEIYYTFILLVSSHHPFKNNVCYTFISLVLSPCGLSTKSEIARKVLSFIHFTHGFRSLHVSELTYFWKLCQARRQQLTFFNQGVRNWSAGVSGREIEVFNPQAWELAGIRRCVWFFRKSQTPHPVIV